VGAYKVQSELPSKLDADSYVAWVPSVVLATQHIMKHGEWLKQWLIQWEGTPAEKATWEAAVVIRSQFPDLNLRKNAGSNDGNQETNNGPQEHLIQGTQNQPKKWIV